MCNYYNNTFFVDENITTPVDYHHLLDWSGTDDLLARDMTSKQLTPQVSLNIATARN